MSDVTREMSFLTKIFHSGSSHLRNLQKLSSIITAEEWKWTISTLISAWLEDNDSLYPYL